MSIFTTEFTIKAEAKKKISNIWWLMLGTKYFKIWLAFKSHYCDLNDKTIVLDLASCHHSVKAILILEDS
ncbi:hypothetical protein TOL5_20920 [Acinetobacter sp. Tol 5]|nr:hypothetical protein TOL5_20920 [Acinetobacter sp. Tol 5]